MYTLIIANKNYSSWSLRPWLLMKTLGIAFEERLIPFSGGASEGGFAHVSPNGKVPCLIDDGGAPVWESLAIVEYLAERHDGVWPRDPAARAWARSAGAEMHAGFHALRDVCTMNIGLRIALRAVPPALETQIARMSALWIEGLERFGGPFLTGDRFTAADAFFAPVAVRMRTYDLPFEDAARAYGERLLDLPAMKDWQRDALAEIWRDHDHEEEARMAGDWIADYRTAP